MAPTVEILRTWANAARSVTTLGGDTAFRESARSIAASVDEPIPSLDLDIRDDVAYQRLLAGLHESPEALARVAASLPGNVIERLQNDLTRHSSRPPPVPANSQAVSEAARSARTMGGYVYGRGPAIFRLARNGSHSDEVIDHYRYSPDLVPGRFHAHATADRLATSEEGFETFERTHARELEAVRDHLETQLAFGPAALRSRYESLRDQIMPHAERSQSRWDDMVRKFRDSNPPDFGRVSKAFWRRDQAIRNHQGLKKRGIGPWEYDLLHMPKEQPRTYFASWAYVLEKITREWESIEGSVTLIDRESRLAELRQRRFDFERAFMAMARGEGKDEDRLAVADAEGRYMGFLSADLSRLDLSEVTELNRNAEDAKQYYIAESHRVNLATTRAQYEYFKAREEVTYAIDVLEQKWQVARYKQMIDQLTSMGAASQSVIQKLRKELRSLVRSYILKGRTYLRVAKSMMNEDPGQREHNRNSAYRDLFLALWELHDKVKEALQKAEVPQADRFELISFSYKTQALFIARGPQGVHGVEPFVEVTLGLKEALDGHEKGGYLLPQIYELAGRDWGINVLSRYAREVHVVGAGKLFPFFGQGLRPESLMVEGGVDAFPTEALGIPQDQFSRRGATKVATHTGQLEFSEAMGIAYLSGLPHTAILAQEGVRRFPIAGPFLGGIKVGGYSYLGSGAYIQRTNDPKKRQSENFILNAHLGMGNFLNIYGGGTRDIANPLPSPYADLKKHPWALHLPGYHPTRYSTGQPVKVAQEAGSPIIPVAHNLDNIYPEPSMPMPPEVQMPNGKDFGALVKGETEPLRKKLSGLAAYPGKLSGFVNQRTMSPYMRPGQDGASVAYGDPIFTESLISEADLESMGYGSQDQNVKWLLLQLNFATVRFGEMRAGYMADAGIYGQ